MLDYSIFKDYYLLRNYQCEEYRSQANSGEKLYINSTEHFHNLENQFQADWEGVVFRQPELRQGKLILSKRGLSLETIIQQYKSNRFDKEAAVFQTKDFKIFISGYLLCLTMVPKSWIKIFDQKSIHFANQDVARWFYSLLNEYARIEKGRECCFLSFYDAAPFVQLLIEGLTDQGYTVSCGLVDYQDLSEEERIRAIQKNEISSIIFTKPKSFSYQHEFRFFVQKVGVNADHIEVKGISLQSSVLLDCAYLAPEYVKRLSEETVAE